MPIPPQPLFPTVDWIRAFDAPFRDTFLATLTALPFDRLRTQPILQRGGLPFIASGLAHYYRSRLNQRERDTYDGFVLRKPLSRQTWIQLIGGEQVGKWMEKGLLSTGTSNVLRTHFRVVCIGSLMLLADPGDVRFSNRVHVGGDSQLMGRFLDRRVLSPRGRLLDVGTGSGVILLHCGRRGTYHEMIGLDINPRAVAVARLNAALNACASYTFIERDIFALTTELGRFDVITWNTPFRFFPESFKTQNVDGYGGFLGIEVGLKFIDLLPTLLTERGEAYLMMSGPVLTDGRRPLDEALDQRVSALDLDIALIVQASTWDAPLRHFHEQFQIKRFEVSILRLIHGRGVLKRFAPNLHVQMLNGARWLRHYARKKGVVEVKERPPNVEVS